MGYSENGVNMPDDLETKDLKDAGRIPARPFDWEDFIEPEDREEGDPKDVDETRS